MKVDVEQKAAREFSRQRAKEKKHASKCLTYMYCEFDENGLERLANGSRK